MSGMICSFDYWQLYTLKHALQSHMKRENKLFQSDEIRERNLLKKIEEERDMFEKRNNIMKPFGGK